MTSGADLKAHYCPQEAFAILSRNKGERFAGAGERAPGRCKWSYILPSCACEGMRRRRSGRIEKSLKSSNFEIIEIYRA